MKNDYNQNINNRIMNENSSVNLNKLLQVDIIDSGLGIEKDRQKYLFIPFLELKAKENIHNVKN
jgi:nitrogen-specific signal transduction histidine kinase